MKQVFDTDRIKSFKRDFLLLMKNVDRIDSYDTAMEWRKAVSIWTNKFDEYLYKWLVKDLKNIMYEEEIKKDKLLIGIIKDWEKQIREKTWGFVIEFRVPIENETEYYTKEQRYQEFLKKVKTWEGSVRRKSRIAWKVLEDFVEWFENNIKKKMVVDVSVEERHELEGFEVVLKGAGQEDKRLIERLKNTLAYYKQRANEVYPPILKRQKPIFVDFKGTLDQAGEFNAKYLTIFNTALYGSIKDITHVLAHEMGHEIWSHYLSGKDQAYWSNFISGNYKELNLKDVYDRYGDSNIWRGGSLHNNSRIKEEDPILYLQIQTLFEGTYDNIKAYENFGSFEDLGKYLKDGNKPMVNVPVKPISGYASKNTEEAFCEALSFLIAYGPRAVLEEVRMVLSKILPDVKVSIITELLKEARWIGKTAIIFDNKKEYDKYMKEHPDADPKNHSIKKQDKSIVKEEEGEKQNEKVKEKIITKKINLKIMDYVKPTEKTEKRARKSWEKSKNFTKEYEEKLKSNIVKTLSECKPYIRIPSECLLGIIKDGRLKSQFETNTSKAILDHKQRNKVENETMGYGKDTKPENRPIYGYLGRHPKDGHLDEYGSVSFQLKNEIKDRSTFVVGDTLGEFENITFDPNGTKYDGIVVPSKINDPNISSVSSNLLNNFEFTADEIETLDLHERETYIEAQYHGGVKLSDIEIIFFDKTPSDEIKKELKKVGLKWAINTK